MTRSYQTLYKLRPSVRRMGLEDKLPMTECQDPHHRMLEGNVSCGFVNRRRQIPLTFGYNRHHSMIQCMKEAR
jgi:hypothetical protein